MPRTTRQNRILAPALPLGLPVRKARRGRRGAAAKYATASKHAHETKARGGGALRADSNGRSRRARGDGVVRTGCWIAGAKRDFAVAQEKQDIGKERLTLPLRSLDRDERRGGRTRGA